MQTMMLPALPQTAWQHCMCPMEASGPQTLPEDAQEAGTRADWHSPLHACGSIVLELRDIDIDIHLFSYH